MRKVLIDKSLIQKQKKTLRHIHLLKFLTQHNVIFVGINLWWTCFKQMWTSIYYTYTVHPAYKVVQIQGMSAYSVRSPDPDSCVCIDIGISESRLYSFSGYRGGPEPFHKSGLHCIYKHEKSILAISLLTSETWNYLHPYTNGRGGRFQIPLN